jgi:REP element-mobilizing transposase RayT
MPQSLAAVYLHLVFSTKNRQPFLEHPGIRDEMYRYFGSISKTLGCTPIRVGGTADHVHILACISRTITIAEWVKELKRVSGIWLHGRSADYEEFQWQSGYGVFSVSQSNLERVTSYVVNQEQHHQEMSFQDELRGLLRKHRIDFDERYLYD